MEICEQLKAAFLAGKRIFTKGDVFEKVKQWYVNILATPSENLTLALKV